MSALHINLFGRLAVVVDGRPITFGPAHTRPLELMAYLLVQRERSHSREALAAVFWPELPGAQAKRNLRKVLCTLQHLLAAAAGPGGPPALLVERGWLTLNPAFALELDVAILEQAYALARRCGDGPLDAVTAQTLEAAVVRYAGELLEGCYSDWCLRERERLENMYLELRHALLVDAERMRAYERAIAHGLAILRHDRANERTHRDLMRLYCLGGDRSAALRQYEHCVAALFQELGVRPRTCTQELYQQICRDELPLPGAAPCSEPAEPQQEPGVHAASSHLQQIRAALQRTLGQVQDDLQRVERLLQQQEVGASRSS